MKSILLVMDMINDLVHPDGPNAQTYAAMCMKRDIIDNVARAIDKSRSAGVAVGYVRVGFSPGYGECPPASPIFARARRAGLFKLGTWGTEVVPALAPRDGDFDIVKHRVSPFYGTNLEPILRARQIGRLVLCGVSTNGVVQAAVREGHDRDYECVLLEDCCCGMTDEEHDYALAGLSRYSRVASAAEFNFAA